MLAPSRSVDSLTRTQRWGSENESFVYGMKGFVYSEYTALHLVDMSCQELPESRVKQGRRGPHPGPRSRTAPRPEQHLQQPAPLPPASSRPRPSGQGARWAKPKAGEGGRRRVEEGGRNRWERRGWAARASGEGVGGMARRAAAGSSSRGLARAGRGWLGRLCGGSSRARPATHDEHHKGRLGQRVAVLVDAEARLHELGLKRGRSEAIRSNKTQ